MKLYALYSETGVFTYAVCAKLQQVDVTTAFLRQPEGFEVKGKENLVCKLKKSHLVAGMQHLTCNWEKWDSFNRKMTRVFTSRTQRTQERYCTLECMWMISYWPEKQTAHCQKSRPLYHWHKGQSRAAWGQLDLDWTTHIHAQRLDICFY